MNGAETGTETGALTEADAAAEAQPHEPVERAGVSCRPIPPPRILHARLQLMSLTFSGGSDIDNDTLGDFKPPHFLVGRKEVVVWRGRFPAQFPYAITRGKKLSAVAVFTVTQQPTGAETVKIDGEAVVHLGCTLKFSGNVAVTPSSTTVTTRVMESDVPLPNEIHRVEPLTINWFQTPVDKPRHPAGSSANTLYITLNTPTTTPLYWTLLEVSCVAASGQKDVPGLRRESYSALQPPKFITRMRDGKVLTYYLPKAANNALSTRMLLNEPDGSGECSSWADFLVQMWKCHGDDGGHSVLIAKNIQAVLDGKSVVDFLVKNWKFGLPQPGLPLPFNYRIDECTKPKGVPGQNNPDPPADFCCHYIVVCTDGLYYDPSYGSPSFGSPEEWEIGSIAGLKSGGRGFRKSSRIGVPRLLEFRDTVNNAKL